MKTISFILLCFISTFCLSQEKCCTSISVNTINIEDASIESNEQHFLTVDFNVSGKAYLLDIYDANGELIQRESLVENTSVFTFYKKGTFSYKIVDPFSLKVKQNGKFST